MSTVNRMCAVLLMGLAPIPVLAQTYPSKPVRIVLPVPAGGIQDGLARAMAPELSAKWGQPVLVENRAGANGLIATEFVARAAPDGYTILMGSSQQVSNDLSQDGKAPTVNPEKEFVPVIALVAAGNILVSSLQFPASTLQEIIAAAKARPGQLNFGSFGIGSSPHLDMEALAALAGFQATHIPYKGGADILQAILGGQIQFSLTGLQPALPLVRQGRIKAIAYGGSQRSSTLPDVPTIAESGFKGFESGGWFGWFVPVATPRTIVDRIGTDASTLITTPAFRDKYVHGIGLDLLNLPSAAFAEKFRTDRAGYAERLKRMAVKN
jgi:tripartite-type tricarboxylate transporter receptor subunit TctC